MFTHFRTLTKSSLLLISNGMKAPLLLLALAVITSSCERIEDYFDSNPSKTILSKHLRTLKSVEVNGDHLSYLDYGNKNKPVVIMLHGIPTSSLLYRDIAKGLAMKEQFRVIALDMLGFGASDKPDRNGAYTLTAQAQRVYDFASALGIKSFVLAIHDAGGPVGWQMLLNEESERIDGLYITDTALEFDGFTPPTVMIPFFSGQVNATEHWNALLADSTAQRETAESLISEGIYNKDRASDELIDAYASAMTQPLAYIEFFDSALPFLSDVSAVKEKIAAFNKPVGILWGQKDPFLDPTIIPQKLQDDFSLEDNAVTFLANASHFLQEDDPKGYVEAFNKFLNENF